MLFENLDQSGGFFSFFGKSIDYSQPVVVSVKPHFFLEDDKSYPSHKVSNSKVLQVIKSKKFDKDYLFGIDNQPWKVQSVKMNGNIVWRCIC